MKDEPRDFTDADAMKNEENAENEEYEEKEEDEEKEEVGPEEEGEGGASCSILNTAKPTRMRK